MNTASIDTGSRLEISSGRSRLSDTDTPSPHTSMKIAQPHCDISVSASTAGAHTSAAPPIGSSASEAASTPNTTGDGRPLMAKPMPTSTPCASAVRPVP
ncbi:hypothetical protein D3C84_1153530 [compost metagenome]